MSTEMNSTKADELLRSTGRDKTGEIMSAWTEWLYAEYGEGLPREVLDAVYGKAWQDGHSAGLTEVEGHFSELIDLALAILRGAGVKR